MTKLAFTIREDKMSVQDYYVQIIFQALEQLGYECKTFGSISEIKDISKESLYVAISHFSLIKLYFRGYKNSLYWIQGSSPDESYMRNHSLLRKSIISCIEYFAITKCSFCFMVSKSMLEHYKRKYRKDFSYKTYVMPCYNSEIQQKLFYTKEKYNVNSFCYVGGLSVWQCFPETVDIYKKFEAILPNPCLKVFTGERDKAIKILQEKKVKNFEVKYVNPDQLVNELAKCKFGFIIRAFSPVNYVATPTKLSNYMAAGLIPIVSNSVGFFGEIFRNSKYSIVLDGLSLTDENIKKISDFANQFIDAKEVYREFSELFSLYYNTNNHINQISNKLRNVLDLN